ncbi:MAG: ABC transporter ATP-binding protein [Pseudorhodoplanes sp.]
MLLDIESITVRYGGLTALDSVSLSVPAGSFTALIGANGAGKSTLFRAISGTAPLAWGRIVHDGADITQMPSYERARRGIAHVPEGRHVFKSMTVEENIEVGTYSVRSRSVSVYDLIFSLFPRLKERRNQFAGVLSGGEQQMLAIGRALASRPSLLLLDEPSMGLSPVLGDEIFNAIGNIHNETGVTVLLVEQRVVEALELCDMGYVLQNGRIVKAGSPTSLLGSMDIGHAYVGLPPTAA